MTLKEWITRTGAVEVARLMRCERASVYHWARGLCLPRSQQMHRIKTLTKGAVTYDSMIDGFVAKSKKRSRK